MLFSNQFKSSKWAPVFILNLKYWYLSKTIPFLKCPLVPTFLLLIKTRRCDKKMETFSLKEPFTWEFFVLLFLSTFKSNLQKENRRSHVKMYKFIFKKEKMKWDENETLCWIMRWGWMTWKWSLAFNNDDGKKLYKTNKIYLQKKIKTSLPIPPASS